MQTMYIDISNIDPSNKEAYMLGNIVFVVKRLMFMPNATKQTVNALLLANAPPWLHISLSSSRNSDAFLCGVRSFLHQFQVLFVLSGITPFICKDSL